jgi:hypothetical protein
MVVAAGAGGVGYRATGQPPAVGQPPAEVGGARGGKPLSEVEALRRENELLRLNLRIVLEKLRALEGAGKHRGIGEKGNVEFGAKDKGYRPKETRNGNFDHKGKELIPKDKRDAEVDPTAKDFLPQHKRDAGFDPRAKGFLPRDKEKATFAPKGEGAKGEPTPLQRVQAALDALRHARDPEAKRRAAEALERASRELQEQLRREGVAPGGGDAKR